MRVLKNDGSSCEIQEEEILYFSNHKNTIYVHTKEGEFVVPTTLSDLYAAYHSSGFERLDRSNVVNLKNVSGYDSERKIVSFEGAGTFATVSESNEKRIKRYMEENKKSST
ncbi:LytTr DNA-binding domain [Chlamydia abortus]|uniref:LytTR family DNA-binding domain-containing protein n=1 Tax=Paenibacillus residui TaxID=629724 RepID=A0ABW3D5A4_9BACL|nr:MULTISPECIES: LytTR family DNA-binding domain-containing protein [Paenibacillaceae]SHE11657.1 LytTr DNA-binding domain [Chlamydia abortus]